MTEVKDVLNGFKERESEESSLAESLRKVIWDALTVLENDQYATRAYNAQMLLKDGLDQYGWPDWDGDDPYGGSNGS